MNSLFLQVWRDVDPPTKLPGLAPPTSGVGTGQCITFSGPKQKMAKKWEGRFFWPRVVGFGNFLVERIYQVVVSNIFGNFHPDTCGNDPI